MAVTYTVLGSMAFGGGKLLHGQWTATSGTSGTIDFRGTLGGTATTVPFNVIWAHAVDVTSDAAMTQKMTTTGTLVIGTFTAADTGTWIAVCR